MVKNAGSGSSSKEQFTIRSGVAKEYSGDRYYRQNEQRDRWLAEHKHNELVEKSLASVSKFSYDPVDYVRFLVKEPFKEPPRQEFQSLLPERLMAAEKRYRQPIMQQWGFMAALILCAAIFPYLVTFVLVAVLLTAVGFLQYKTFQDRTRVLTKIERDTRLEIETKRKAQEEAIEEQRRLHEAAEEDRVSFYVRLMNGDEPAVILTLDQFMPQISLPFPLDLDIDLYGRIFVIRVWLPPKALVPSERSSLTEAGRIQYEKKESLEINKQYAELCAGLMMQVACTLFSRIPTVDRVYVHGMSKEGRQDDCLMTMQLDRSRLEKVQRASTALLALQGLSAVYECDEFLKLMPVQPLQPEEWADLDRKSIRNLRVKIFKWAVPGMRNKIVEDN